MMDTKFKPQAMLLTLSPDLADIILQQKSQRVFLRHPILNNKPPFTAYIYASKACRLVCRVNVIETDGNTIIIDGEFPAVLNLSVDELKRLWISPHPMHRNLSTAQVKAIETANVNKLPNLAPKSYYVPIEEMTAEQRRKIREAGKERQRKFQEKVKKHD